MADDNKALSDAQARLKELEAPGRTVADANVYLRRAEATGDKGHIAEAQEAYLESVAARDKAGITDRQIAEAAQAVLDASNQSHTEVGVNPNGLGIRTVEAGAKLAEAIARNTGVEAAHKALADAEKADADEKAQHADDSHKETIAARAAQ